MFLTFSYLSLLSLSTEDLSLLLFTQSEPSLLLTLTYLRQASSHGSLLQGLSILYRSTAAHAFDAHPHWSSGRVMDGVDRGWWDTADLARFFTIHPACSADFNLLAALLVVLADVTLFADDVSPARRRSGAVSEVSRFELSCLMVFVERWVFLDPFHMNRMLGAFSHF